MEIYNANKIWEKLIKSLKKEDVILEEALISSKVIQATNNMWKIETIGGLGIFQKSVIFDNKDSICQLLKSEYNINVDIQFYDKNDKKDQANEQFGITLDILRKCLEENELSLITVQKVICVKMFINVLEILGKKINTYDLIDNFFKYYKLHNIKYYKNEKFINMFVTLRNKKCFSNLAFKDIHFLAFFYYYLIYDLEIKFEDFAFKQDLLTEKEEIIKMYEKYKNEGTYFIEEENRTKYKKIDEYMDELENMIGLENIKNQKESIIN